MCIFSVYAAAADDDDVVMTSQRSCVHISLHSRLRQETDEDPLQFSIKYVFT